MSFEEDPEVVADLQLRAHTEYDKSRTRGAGVYDWKKPGDVAWWKCRGGCGALVGVTEDVCEYRAMFNAMLKKRGEASIPDAGIVLCDSCRSRLSVERALIVFDRKGEIAEAIRKLKDHGNPRNAEEILALLKKRHHPDISGLLEAIDGKRASKNNVRQRASGL